MNVLSSYPYHAPAEALGSQDVAAANTFAGFMAPMSNKRRRLNEGAGIDEPWEASSAQQAQQSFVIGSSDLEPAYASAGDLPGPEGAAYASTAAAFNASTTAPPGNEGSEATAQWRNPAGNIVGSAGAAVSAYPDVASYSQQPYFYQQTDPNAYNSPWPPAEPGAFASQASSYNVPAPAVGSAMPFFPQSQTTAETSEDGFEGVVSTAVGSYPRDVQLPPLRRDISQDDDGRHAGDGAVQPPTTYYDDASMHLKIQSLPILENLATQLIHTIAKSSFPQIQEIMRGADNEESQAYTTLKNLFDQTRKVYSRDTPFIDAIAIQMFQPNQQETIRKANIATFISSILGAHDVSFFHLNEFFMETFVPLGHRLLKWQGAIYLELKTQTYISALINSDGEPEAMLDELFPPDLDAQILTRHPDAPSLSPSEQDFIDRSRARKSYLLAEDGTEDALRELPKKYQWQDFVREFASCINKNVDGIMNVPARSQLNFGNASTHRSATAAQALQDAAGRNSQALFGRNADNTTGLQTLSLALSMTERGNSNAGTSSHRDPKPSVPPSTIRQPWTKPEEDALLSGLEKVNGPHWSQILALYGRGGSISEVLKDRNQVQLKDKARNLKLYHLKMGKDVPAALKGVTGELRKRGGARARAALSEEGVEEVGEGEAMDVDEEVESGGRGKKLGRKKSKKGT